MSSKSAENTPASASRRMWSITQRLTFLYALSASGILLIASVFLYHVLTSNLEREDNQFLANKIHVLRVILRERPDNPEALEEEVKWEGAAFRFIQYLEEMNWGLETAIRGASERLAPILMTALVTALGLLPLAIGSGAPGREIEGPMAIVILGGLTTSTVLNLLVLPTLALRYGSFEKKDGKV